MFNLKAHKCRKINDKYKNKHLMKIKAPEEITLTNLNNDPEDEDDFYYYDGTNLYKGDFIVPDNLPDIVFEC